MLVRPTTELYACVTADGTYVPEMVLTEPEFADTVLAASVFVRQFAEGGSTGRPT